jgi:LAS superfamily LD-carboxypeptidase LdcB
MNAGWTLARPFVRATRSGGCPDAPDAAALATATPAESYGGKTILLRADTLAAWRQLVAAARRDLPELAPTADWLRIFSGFRHPLDDDVRCWTDNNCQGVSRAACSAHRTGVAIDVFVGHAEGQRPDSSDNANRRAMTQTATYRWLVQNARRFGFANYVFEPWHWEWAPPGAGTPTVSTPPPRRGMTPG